MVYSDRETLHSKNRPCKTKLTSNVYCMRIGGYERIFTVNPMYMQFQN